MVSSLAIAQIAISTRNLRMSSLRLYDGLCTTAVRPTCHRSFCVSSGLVCQRPLDESHVLLKLVALTCLKVAQAWVKLDVVRVSVLHEQVVVRSGCPWGWENEGYCWCCSSRSALNFDKLAAANRCLNECLLTSYPVQSSCIFGTPVEAVDTQCIPLHYKPVMAAACLRAHAAGLTVVRYTIHIAKEKRKTKPENQTEAAT